MVSRRELLLSTAALGALCLAGCSRPHDEQHYLKPGTTAETLERIRRKAGPDGVSQVILRPQSLSVVYADKVWQSQLGDETIVEAPLPNRVPFIPTPAPFSLDGVQIPDLSVLIANAQVDPFAGSTSGSIVVERALIHGPVGAKTYGRSEDDVELDEHWRRLPGFDPLSTEGLTTALREVIEMGGARAVGLCRVSQDGVLTSAADRELSAGRQPEQELHFTRRQTERRVTLSDRPTVLAGSVDPAAIRPELLVRAAGSMTGPWRGTIEVRDGELVYDAQGKDAEGRPANVVLDSRGEERFRSR